MYDGPKRAKLKPLFTGKKPKKGRYAKGKILMVNHEELEDKMTNYRDSISQLKEQEKEEDPE